VTRGLGQVLMLGPTPQIHRYQQGDGVCFSGPSGTCISMSGRKREAQAVGSIVMFGLAIWGGSPWPHSTWEPRKEDPRP
jgi:hypothetical protein